jgi:hypothetical protein
MTTTKQMKKTHAIRTKYLGPTNHKGSRIKATLAGDLLTGETPFTATLPFDYGLRSGHEEHLPAAQAVLAEIKAGMWGGYGWDKAEIVGYSYIGKGEYLFTICFADEAF